MPLPAITHEYGRHHSERPATVSVLLRQRLLQARSHLLRRQHCSISRPEKTSHPDLRFDASRQLRKGKFRRPTPCPFRVTIAPGKPGEWQPENLSRLYLLRLRVPED